MAKLYELIERQDLPAIESQLREGVSSPLDTNAHGMPCIAVAAMLGGVRILQTLLDEPVDNPTVRAAHLSNALGVAAATGRSAEVQLLLARGADPNASSDGAVSARPLWQCVFSADSNPATLRALLLAGADTSPEDENGLHISDYLTPEQRRTFEDVLGDPT
jgi:ankyrin repeat protein